MDYQKEKKKHHETQQQQKQEQNFQYLSYYWPYFMLGYWYQQQGGIFAYASFKWW